MHTTVQMAQIFCFLHIFSVAPVRLYNSDLYWGKHLENIIQRVSIYTCVYKFFTFGDWGLCWLQPIDPQLCLVWLFVCSIMGWIDIRVRLTWKNTFCLTPTIACNVKFHLEDGLYYIQLNPTSQLFLLQRVPKALEISWLVTWGMMAAADVGLRLHGS